MKGHCKGQDLSLLVFCLVKGKKVLQRERMGVLQNQHYCDFTIGMIVKA